MQELTQILNPRTGANYTMREAELIVQTVEDAKRIIRADFERRRKAASRKERWRANKRATG